MKKLITILLAAILIQTSYAEDKIKISINKDQNGRITLVSSGHSTPISFDIMGKNYDVPAGGGSVEIESKEFEVKKEEIKTTESELAKEETAANNDQAQKMKEFSQKQEQQQQAQQIQQTTQQQRNEVLNIPPVNSKPNPPEATPI